jgi:hypothetical protein
MARFVALFATIAVVAAGATTATGRSTSDLHGSGFRTPSRNIACEVDEHAAVGPFKGQRTLFCVVFSASSATRGQRTWLMRTTGRARVAWVVGNIATEVPVLAYGRSWSFEGYRCGSRRSGLTCRNQSRHGFFLSKQVRRTF